VIEQFASEFLGRVGTALSEVNLDEVRKVAEALERAYRKGRTVFIMGNGGSSASASHLACDLRYAEGKQNRLQVMCLTDNVPLVTALGNDLGHSEVFKSQFEQLISTADVVIVLSVSGDSENIVQAADFARQHGALTVGFLGSDGGRTQALMDIHLTTSSSDFSVVESVHCVLTQMLAAIFQRLASE
jgi:D-sedoheptulose 7-phosphate isomerase